ncbi:MAG: transcription antitermination factor NusB [Candidatus Cloacimonetes bacterium]|nr:transcription antitermination factor NusB [Candidatus Cloacimonadota bacterium]
MGMRRKGREIALQTLYSLDYVETGAYLQELELLDKFREQLVDIAADQDIDEENRIFLFAEDLIANVLRNLEPIDIQINGHSTNWKVERLALLDKSLLRIATYELLFTDTAPAIVMNEAIEIAKKYCSESSGKFINGVLNGINEELTHAKNPC